MQLIKSLYQHDASNGCTVLVMQVWFDATCNAELANIQGRSRNSCIVGVF